MEYESLGYLGKIRRLKYKAAAFPIILVLCSFILNSVFKIEEVKYLSIIGLVLYVFILLRFKISRAHPPTSKYPIILAPIFGKIVKIKDNRIEIRKNIFQPADIRATKCEIKSNYKHIFEEEFENSAKLIGIIPWFTECVCTIPDDFEVIVKIGEKIEAGETILAEKRND